MLVATCLHKCSGQPPTSTFYDPAVDFLGLVGDFDKFVDAFPNENAVKVVSARSLDPFTAE